MIEKAIYNLFWMGALVFGLILIHPPKTTGQTLRRSTLSSNGSSNLIQLGGNNYQIQSSIGQASVIGKGVSDGYELRQGFIQAYHLIRVTSSEMGIELRVFPVPTRDILNIVPDEKLGDELEMRLYSSSGQCLIYQKKQTGLAQYQLDLSQLAAGSYTLHFVSGNRREVVLIQKMN